MRINKQINCDVVKNKKLFGAPTAFHYLHTCGCVDYWRVSIHLIYNCQLCFNVLLLFIVVWCFWTRNTWSMMATFICPRSWSTLRHFRHQFRVFNPMAFWTRANKHWMITNRRCAIGYKVFELLMLQGLRIQLSNICLFQNGNFLSKERRSHRVWFSICIICWIHQQLSRSSAAIIEFISKRNK